MRKLICLFIPIVLLFPACSEKKGASGLKFETIAVNKTMRLPAAKGENEVLEYAVRFTYPSDFGDKKVLALLKQHFIEHVLGSNPSELPPDEIVNALVGEWKADYMTGAEEFGMNWGREVSDSILYVSDELLQYRVYAYDYRGGAHPSVMISYHLLDLQTGNEYKQSDIFKSEKADELRDLIMSHIFKLWKRPEDSETKQVIMDHVWTPETNFGVTEEGILIGYSDYELGGYVFGRPEVLIPYSEVLNYLKEDTWVYAIATTAAEKNKRDISDAIEDDYKYIITEDRAGTFVLHNDMPQALDNYTIRKETYSMEGFDFQKYILEKDGKDELELYPLYSEYSASNKISDIIVLSDKFKTVEGAKVGSTIEELVEKYPEGEFSFSYISGRFIFSIKTKQMQFILDHEGFIAGKENRADDFLYASDWVVLKQTDFNPGTKVTSIRIWMI